MLDASKAKFAAALDIFFASIDAYAAFDPARLYTPKEREPYDALTDRYLRAFESSLNEGVRFERRAFHSMFALDEQTEGMSAFVEKRDADFRHR